MVALLKLTHSPSRLTENIPVSDPIEKHPWFPTLPNCRVKYGSRAQIRPSYAAGVISVSNSPVSGLGMISTCLKILIVGNPDHHAPPLPPTHPPLGAYWHIC
jgi:hypothetical protein